MRDIPTLDNPGFCTTVSSVQVLATDDGSPRTELDNHYFQPDGVSLYYSPDAISLYEQPTN